MTPMQAISFPVAGVLLAAVALAGAPAPRAPGDAEAVSAKLSEWKVELSEGTIAAGTVTFRIANTGSIPHAFEVEGQGIEKKTAEIQPGSSVALTLTLKPGTYEVYCPEAEDSHKMLGMETHLTVVGGKGSGSSEYSYAGMGGPA
ncbi:MAG TPA: cupredoxin domain-containing protein [Gemmatimonadaceae bacterium]|nr:cupredoxin domain-containing protein [Gemmatimonadaceae bacterium]